MSAMQCSIAGTVHDIKNHGEFGVCVLVRTSPNGDGYIDVPVWTVKVMAGNVWSQVKLGDRVVSAGPWTPSGPDKAPGVRAYTFAIDLRSL